MKAKEKEEQAEARFIRYSRLKPSRGAVAKKHIAKRKAGAPMQLYDFIRGLLDQGLRYEGFQTKAPKKKPEFEADSSARARLADNGPASAKAAATAAMRRICARRLPLVRWLTRTNMLLRTWTHGGEWVEPRGIACGLDTGD